MPPVKEVWKWPTSGVLL
uniref:Uncharacterized protein n=1 Tax=Anguilla anguilla TaxID=7936 RepID=A0A0E9XA10_ANGAN